MKEAFVRILFTKNMKAVAPIDVGELRTVLEFPLDIKVNYR